MSELCNASMNCSFASVSLTSDVTVCKVDKRTQEIIQSDPHQAPNTKGKDIQIQKSSHEMNRWKAELETLSQKGGNSYQNLTEYIINLYNC